MEEKMTEGNQWEGCVDRVQHDVHTDIGCLVKEYGGDCVGHNTEAEMAFCKQVNPITYRRLLEGLGFPEHEAVHLAEVYKDTVFNPIVSMYKYRIRK
jgi:hypothetical protein